jgi:hypothetical protein
MSSCYAVHLGGSYVYISGYIEFVGGGGGADAYVAGEITITLNMEELRWGCGADAYVACSGYTHSFICTICLKNNSIICRGSYA